MNSPIEESRRFRSRAAENAVAQIRAEASEADRQRVEQLYQATMGRTRELVLAREAA